MVFPAICLGRLMNFSFFPVKYKFFFFLHSNPSPINIKNRAYVLWPPNCRTLSLIVKNLGFIVPFIYNGLCLIQELIESIGLLKTKLTWLHYNNIYFSTGKICRKSPDNTIIFPPNGKLFSINNRKLCSILSKSILLIIVTHSTKRKVTINPISALCPP